MSERKRNQEYGLHVNIAQLNFLEEDTWIQLAQIVAVHLIRLGLEEVFEHLRGC